MKSLTFKSQVILATILNLISVTIIGCLLFSTQGTLITIALGSYVVLAGVLTFGFFTKFSIAFIKLQNILKISKSLALGKVETVKPIDASEQELKELANASLSINQTYNDLVALATEIGNKNFDFEFSPKSEDDKLSKAMVSMKESLREIAEKDAQQNWIAAGLAKFGDLLRTENESLEKLSFIVISNLCRYLDANQGGLFVYSDEEGVECLDLVASFAYNKQKFVDKKIILQKEAGRYVYGEGLVGQAFIDKDTIFMTDVPENFVKITSGLGESLPRNILVVPLQYNDDIVGIIELASFRVFKEYEKNFVEKLCVQIGATIVAEKVNKRTRQLLIDSQKQSEELLKKEEDMKQSYEEMSAIQEELSRNEKELMLLKENLEDEVRRQTSELEIQKEEILKEQQRAIQKEKQVSAILNGTEASIFLTSEDGNIIIANEATSMLMGYSVNELVGLDYKVFLQVEKMRMGRTFRQAIIQKSGTEVMCEILVNKMGIDGEKANLFYIVDITNQLKTEAKFNARIAELEAELAQLKGGA